MNIRTETKYNLVGRVREISAQLEENDGEGIHANARIAMRAERQAIRRELSERAVCEALAKLDPYDNAHGLDR